MEGEPAKYCLSERLTNINQDITVLTINLAIINKERCIAPENI